MAETSPRRKNWALLIATLALLAPTSGAFAASRLTAVEVAQVRTEGDYVRVTGMVRGVVSPGEDVVGLADLPRNADGDYAYSSAFEIVTAAPGRPVDEAIYVDAENRGSAISQGALGAFLPRRRTAYARVQWQTGISPGVPQNAQGVGLVIMRDFARWLAGRTPAAVTGDWKPAGAYPKLMLGGISQSAWFVNTFIAEGFNVDPATGARVFDGAIAVDGVGGWLAINRIAAQRGVVGQTPYVDPNGLPLSRAELLRRLATDPVYVDIANFTDFYRLRAGLTSTDFSGRNFRRYDFPSPHAVGTSAARCNDGAPIRYLDLRYAPYMRALVLGLEQAIGVPGAAGARPLPPTAVFRLGDAPKNVRWFNPLPGVEVKTPVLDPNGWPVGGVRFPEGLIPLGQPSPPSVPPVTTASISQTCGNYAGFEPFSAAERASRYGDKAAWLARYRASLERLESEGFLLAEDLPAMVQAASEAFDRP